MITTDVASFSPTAGPALVPSTLAKIPLSFQVGHFTAKTIGTMSELNQAFALRTQVFQIEMIGQTNFEGVDTDQFDLAADHLAIIDHRTGEMVATCRLSCSLFTNRFYSEQEFQCQELMARPEIKLELGRVCIHPDFRKGAILLMLWRAIGQYMVKTNADIMFGCGSVMTESAPETELIYRYLQEQNKVRISGAFGATEKYRFHDFERELLTTKPAELTYAETLFAKELLPPLCQSYFDMGCYTPGHPALDREFKCVDFLTVLERKELDPRLRRKLLGEG